MPVYLTAHDLAAVHGSSTTSHFIIFHDEHSTKAKIASGRGRNLPSRSRPYPVRMQDPGCKTLSSLAELQEGTLLSPGNTPICPAELSSPPFHRGLGRTLRWPRQSAAHCVAPSSWTELDCAAWLAQPDLESSELRPKTTRFRHAPVLDRAVGSSWKLLLSRIFTCVTRCFHEPTIDPPLQPWLRGLEHVPASLQPDVASRPCYEIPQVRQPQRCSATTKAPKPSHL